jgi:hypothetical protein
MNRMFRQLALVVALIPYLSSAAAAADSLCSAQEIVVYSCSAGAKIISVCASKDVSSASGYVQYRFGRKRALELVLPKTRGHSASNPKSGTLMFSGGGGAYLRFSNGQVSYVVYSAVGKGWGDASVKCVGTVTSEMGPDFFAKAGLPQDDEDFDLP